MSPSELADIIKLCKESGITHFKCGDVELSFSPAVFCPPQNLKPVSLEVPPEIPDKEPPHIVQEMKRLITATDEELIDRMFPVQTDEAIN